LRETETEIETEAEGERQREKRQRTRKRARKHPLLMILTQLTVFPVISFGVVLWEICTRMYPYDHYRYERERTQTGQILFHYNGHRQAKFSFTCGCIFAPFHFSFWSLSRDTEGHNNQARVVGASIVLDPPVGCQRQIEQRWNRREGETKSGEKQCEIEEPIERERDREQSGIERKER
jgi:hypothetical protein